MSGVRRHSRRQTRRNAEAVVEADAEAVVEAEATRQAAEAEAEAEAEALRAAGEDRGDDGADEPLHVERRWKRRLCCCDASATVLDSSWLQTRCKRSSARASLSSSNAEASADSS